MTTTGDNLSRKNYDAQLNDSPDCELVDLSLSLELYPQQYPPEVMNNPMSAHPEIRTILNSDYIFTDLIKKLDTLKNEVEISERRMRDFEPSIGKDHSIAEDLQQPPHFDMFDHTNCFINDAKLKLDEYYSILYETEPQYTFRNDPLIVNYQMKSKTKKNKQETGARTSSFKAPPHLHSVSKDEVSGSRVTAGKFANIRRKESSLNIDVDSPLPSTSLYVDPYLGCNQDCTGTKMPNGKHQIVEINAENASTVPLLQNEELFHDGKSTKPQHHEKPAQNSKYNLCDCRTYLDVQSFRHKRNAFRQEGIPHKTFRNYSTCRELEPISCSMSREHLARKRIHQEPETKEYTKKRQYAICSSGIIHEDDVQPFSSSKPKQQSKPEHACRNCRCSVPKMYCEDEKVSRPSRKPQQAAGNQHSQRRPSKSIGCQAGDSSNSKNTEIGRNITIEIIPQRYQNIESGRSSISNNPSPRPEVLDKTELGEGTLDPGVQVMEHEPADTHKKNEEHMQEPSTQTEQRQCWWACSWRRKKEEDPYYRRHKAKHNAGPDTTQAVQEPADNERTKTSQNYAQFSIEHFGNREHILKSCHRMNKGLIRDLFATPSPSFAAACPRSCVRKIRGFPYPMCCGDPNAYSSVLEPVTANQCCQSEPKETEPECCIGKDRIFFECIKYLMNRVARNEDCYDYDDGNEDCWCCCQSFNCCPCQIRSRCCCCRRPERKIECKKREERICTCERFVEVKRSVKDFGVNATPAEKITRSAATNTESPKTAKSRKCRCCCPRPRPQCCQCCRRMPMCCCQMGRHCCDDGSNLEYNDVRLPPPRPEHIVFCCQCEKFPRFPDSKPSTPLQVRRTTSRTGKSVSIQTKVVGTIEMKPKTPTQKPENSRKITPTIRKSNEKLNVRNSDEPKGLSRYHQNSSKTSVDNIARNETYHVMNFEELYQVPWLEKYQHFLQPDVSKILPKNLVGIEPEKCTSDATRRNIGKSRIFTEDTVSKIQYLSGIFEAILTSRGKNTDKFTKNVGNPTSIVNNETFPSIKEVKKSDIFKSDDSSAINITQVGGTDDLIFEPKTQKTERKLENNIKTYHEIGNVSMSSNKPTVSNMYTSRPFTTKTGLMSYIPPSRDSFLNYSVVNQSKTSSKKDTKLSKRPSIQNQTSIPKIIRNPMPKKDDVNKIFSPTNTKTSEQKENMINENIKKSSGTSLNPQSTKQLQCGCKYMTSPYSLKKGIKTPESPVRNIESKKISNIFKKEANETFSVQAVSSRSFLHIINCDLGNDSRLESLGNNCIADQTGDALTLRDFLFLS